MNRPWKVVEGHFHYSVLLGVLVVPLRHTNLELN